MLDNFNALNLNRQFVSIFTESLSLELTNVIIPAYKFHGESAVLECQYELSDSEINDRNNKNSGDYNYRSIDSIANDDNSDAEHFHQQHHSQQHQQSYHQHQNGETETIYSVKWYKDNEEFYRYVPKANPPQQSYRIEGIRVDVSKYLFSLFCYPLLLLLLSSLLLLLLIRSFICKVMYLI